jgi:hypothetical protein
VVQKVVVVAVGAVQFCIVGALAPDCALAS